MAECGGAYVNAWIERESADEAVAMACGIVEAEGWAITEVERVVPVTSDSMAGRPGLKYYEQALTDKEVLVFYRYPIPELEEDDDEEDVEGGE